ncbi:MAG: preprotein translocase subunit SecE [bacterium]|nr:preprotein translocase subunit SecE [bacterium]MDE0353961.1 preprotein translocase subunit SecE [bacterium]
MNREMRRMAEREERRNKQQGDRRRTLPGSPGGDGSVSGRLGRLVQFLREVRVELSRVNWPNRRQMIAFTTVTVITTGVLTGYVFLVDLALSRSVLAGIRALTG